MKRFVLTAAALVLLGGGLPMVAPESGGPRLAAAQDANDAADENLDEGGAPATSGNADAAAEDLDQGSPVVASDETLQPPPSDANLPAPATDTTVAPASVPAPAAVYEPGAELAYAAPAHPAPGPTPIPFPFNSRGGLIVQARQSVDGLDAPFGFDTCSYQVSNGKAFVGVHCEPPAGGDPFSGFPFDSASSDLAQRVGSEADATDSAADTTSGPSRKKNRPAAASSDTEIVGRDRPPVVQGAEAEMVGDTLVVRGEETGLNRTREIFRNAGQTIKDDSGGNNNVKVPASANNDGKNDNGKNNKNKNKKNKKNNNKNNNKKKNGNNKQSNKQKNQVSKSNDGDKSGSNSAKSSQSDGKESRDNDDR